MTNLIQMKPTATIESREVAGMVGKQHKILLRDIRRVRERFPLFLNEFKESFYFDLNKQKRPCFLITEKGKRFLSMKYEHQIRPRKLELDFKISLETLLDGIVDFDYQYRFGDYILDFYNPALNFVVEYDEKEHRSRLESDEERQEWLEKEMGCEFIRVREGYELQGINEILKYVKTGGFFWKN